MGDARCRLKTASRRQPRSGQKVFTLMSLHINNNCAKKRGIGKKLLLTIRAIMQEEYVDLVAGDFNGAAWRQSSRKNPQPTGTLEGAFVETDFPMPWCSSRRMGRCLWLHQPPNGRFVHMVPSQFPGKSLASTTLWTLSRAKTPACTKVGSRHLGSPTSGRLCCFVTALMDQKIHVLNVDYLRSSEARRSCPCRSFPCGLHTATRQVRRRHRHCCRLEARRSAPFRNLPRGSPTLRISDSTMKRAMQCRQY